MTANAIAFLRTLKAHIDHWTPTELYLYCNEIVPTLDLRENQEVVLWSGTKPGKYRIISLQSEDGHCNFYDGSFLRCSTHVPISRSSIRSDDLLTTTMMRYLFFMAPSCNESTNNHEYLLYHLRDLWRTCAWDRYRNKQAHRALCQEPIAH